MEVPLSVDSIFEVHFRLFCLAHEAAGSEKFPEPQWQTSCLWHQIENNLAFVPDLPVSHKHFCSIAFWKVFVLSHKLWQFFDGEFPTLGKTKHLTKCLKRNHRLCPVSHFWTVNPDAKMPEHSIFARTGFFP
jgi:hypothetical protein